jgi:N-acyl homoserine lactone hydrolase
MKERTSDGKVAGPRRAVNRGADRVRLTRIRFPLGDSDMNAGQGPMTDVRRLIPILTGRHRYDSSLSLHGRAAGTTIEAPILAYLIDTAHGRVLYDVGCDYRKIADPVLRQVHYGPGGFPFGPPEMREQDRLPALLARLGIMPRDIDAVVLGHLHFDHAGGLADFVGAEIHCHADEWAAAQLNADGAYFAGDLEGAHRWRLDRGERALCAGLHLVDSPGHTAGHRSLLIERPDGAPVLLAGDAADLQENLDDEVAPGILWRDGAGQLREDLALASIRRLKALAHQQGAELWPNHDLAHWDRLRQRAWPTLAAP